MTEEEEGDDDLQGKAEEENRASLVPVRGKAAGQGEKEGREELGQPHHAQGECASRQVIHVPADRDGEHE